MTTRYRWLFGVAVLAMAAWPAVLIGIIDLLAWHRTNRQDPDPEFQRGYTLALMKLAKETDIKGS